MFFKGVKQLILKKSTSIAYGDTRDSMEFE